jgi:MFS family permease
MGPSAGADSIITLPQNAFTAVNSRQLVNLSGHSWPEPFGNCIFLPLFGMVDAVRKNRYSLVNRRSKSASDIAAKAAVNAMAGTGGDAREPGAAAVPASVPARCRPPGGKLAVLAERNFRRFYVGYATSSLGTAMSSVAVAFAVLRSGGTATELGLVFAANIVPMVVFTLGGGIIADRLGRRPVMLAADVARCAAQGTLAAILFFGSPQLWLFVATALIVGTGNALFQPALSGLTVEIAPRDQLGDANALFGMAQPAARVAGPALAGILIAVTTPAVVIAVDAGTYAISALALSLLRFRDAGQVKAPSLFRDMAEGWAQFTANTWLWLETVQFALFNLLTWGPYLVLGPVLARQYLGGARAWGAIMAAYGGGAILGGLLVLGRRPRRPLLVSTLATFGYPLPPLMLALHVPAAAVAAGALMAGLGSAAAGALSTTVTQQRVPAAALARVGAFNMVGAFAFGPIAFAAAGPVAAALSARAVLGFGAAWAAFGSAVLLAVPAVRRVTWRDSPPPGSDSQVSPAGTGTRPS